MSVMKNPLFQVMKMSVKKMAVKKMQVKKMLVKKMQVKKNPPVKHTVFVAENLYLKRRTCICIAESYRACCRYCKLIAYPACC